MRTSWPWPMATVADQWRRSCSRHFSSMPAMRAGSLPPPADAVGADELGTEAEHPRAVRLALAAQRLDGGDGVGVEGDGAGVGGLRRRVAELAVAVAAARRSRSPSRSSASRRAGRSTAARPARRGGRRRRRRSAASSAAAGSIDAAAAITARTSSSVITVRRWRLRRAQPGHARHVGAHPAPPDRLRQRGPQHAVLVLDAGVAHPVAPQPGVPALDVADRQAGERQPGDLVLLDAADAALLVARRRRRPRVEVLLDPRVEDVAHRSGRRATTRPGPTSISAASAQRVALAAVDRLGQLGRPAVGRRCP